MRNPITALSLSVLLMAPAGAQLPAKLSQSAIIRIHPGKVEIILDERPGPELAAKIIQSMDGDRDGKISVQESSAAAEVIRARLTLTLDGSPLAVKLTDDDFPDLAEFSAGIVPHQLVFTAFHGPLSPGEHRLVLANSHLPADSTFHIHAAEPESRDLKIHKLIRNENHSQAELVFELLPDLSALQIATGESATGFRLWSWLAGGLLLLAAALVAFFKLKHQPRPGG